jgi:putative membrane protein
VHPPFDWSWHPHPDAWLLSIGIAAAYLFAIRRRERNNSDPLTVVATRKQKTAFLSGCLVLLISAEWPIHDLAEGYLYSVHMVQHLLLTLLMAPLFLVGMPAWMMRALLPGGLLKIARQLTRPLPALVIANSILVLTHWPALVNQSVGNELLHLGLHVLVVFSGLIMWMPVLSPLLELPTLSKPAQCGYLFLQSLVPTVPASFLTFGSHPLYSIYANFPHPFDISTLSDQRTAGLIMKIIGGLVLWGGITAIWFQWMNQESRQGTDALAHAGTNRALDRVEI